MAKMNLRFPKNDATSKHDLYFIQFNTYKLEPLGILPEDSTTVTGSENIIDRISPEQIFNYEARASEIQDIITLPLQTTPKEETSAQINDSVSTKMLSRIAAGLNPEGTGEAIGAQITEMIAGKISPELLSVIRASEGQAINEQMQVVFEGPNRRSYSFEFTLVAKNYEEAVEARKIAKRLQYNASPSLSSQKLYFKYPNLVKFHFLRRNENQAMDNLFRSKFCYIESVNVEYGDGVYNEFVNIEGQKETGIFRISVTLKEAEYMLKDDFWSEDEDA